MKIYLAGPDVFLPDAVDIGRRKVELCMRHGLIGLYPLENAVDRAATDASLQIFRGNVCLGYSNDPSSYADRVREFTDVNSRDGRLVDAAGLTVEDFELTDNLMMIHALDLHGCAAGTPRQGPADIWHDLTAFESCVRMAAGRIASAPARASS